MSATVGMNHVHNIPCVSHANNKSLGVTAGRTHSQRGTEVSLKREADSAGEEGDKGDNEGGMVRSGWRCGLHTHTHVRVTQAHLPAIGMSVV